MSWIPLIVSSVQLNYLQNDLSGQSIVFVVPAEVPHHWEKRCDDENRGHFLVNREGVLIWCVSIEGKKVRW